MSDGDYPVISTHPWKLSLIPFAIVDKIGIIERSFFQCKWYIRFKSAHSVEQSEHVPHFVKVKMEMERDQKRPI